MSASVLYTNERITLLKELGLQFHYHENEANGISAPKILTNEQVGTKERLVDLNNYEAAMGDFYAQQLSLPQIKKGS